MQESDSLNKAIDMENMERQKYARLMFDDLASSVNDYCSLREQIEFTRNEISLTRKRMELLEGALLTFSQPERSGATEER